MYFPTAPWAIVMFFNDNLSRNEICGVIKTNDLRGYILAKMNQIHYSHLRKVFNLNFVTRVFIMFCFIFPCLEINPK